jgi:hypothetical protein
LYFTDLLLSRLLLLPFGAASALHGAVEVNNKAKTMLTLRIFAFIPTSLGRIGILSKKDDSM